MLWAWARAIAECIAQVSVALLSNTHSAIDAFCVTRSLNLSFNALTSVPGSVLFNSAVSVDASSTLLSENGLPVPLPGTPSSRTRFLNVSHNYYNHLINDSVLPYVVSWQPGGVIDLSFNCLRWTDPFFDSTHFCAAASLVCFFGPQTCPHSWNSPPAPPTLRFVLAGVQEVGVYWVAPRASIPALVNYTVCATVANGPFAISVPDTLPVYGETRACPPSDSGYVLLAFPPIPCAASGVHCENFGCCVLAVFQVGERHGRGNRAAYTHACRSVGPALWGKLLHCRGGSE